PLREARGAVLVLDPLEGIDVVEVAPAVARRAPRGVPEDERRRLGGRGLPQVDDGRRLLLAEQTHLASTSTPGSSTDGRQCRPFDPRAVVTVALSARCGRRAATGRAGRRRRGRGTARPPRRRG